jgi:hypothetical protein
MLLQLFGTTNSNGRHANEDVFVEAQSVRSPVKYACGLWCTMYDPESERAQFDGMDSSVDPPPVCPKSDVPAIGCDDGPESSVTPNVEPPVIAR